MKSTRFIFFFCILGLYILFTACKPEPNRQGIESHYSSNKDWQTFVKVDSILEVYDTLYSPPERAFHYIAISKLLTYRQASSAISYAQQAYQIGVLERDKPLQAEAMYCVALGKKYYYFYGEGIKDAIEDAEISLDLARQAENPYWEAMALNLLGLLYQPIDSLKKAQKLQESALQALNRSNLSDSLHQLLRGEIYHSLANTYAWGEGDFQQARSFYRESEQLYQMAQNQQAAARLQIDLGHFARREGDPKLAESHYLRSLDFGRSQQNTDLITNAKEALTKLKRSQYTSQAKAGTINKPLIREAEALANENLTMLTESEFRPYFDLGMIFHARREAEEDSATVHNQKALAYYLQAYESAAREGQIETLGYLSTNMKYLCGDPEKSCFETYAASVPSLQQQMLRLAVDTVRQSEIKASKKRRAFDQLWAEDQLKHTRLRLIGIWSMIILILGTIFGLLYQRAQKRQLVARIEALRAQINPHFVSNTINAIEGLVNTDKKEAASDYLADFAHLSRDILTGSRKGFHTLEKEIQTLTKYLDLLKLRFRDKFTYNIEITTPKLDPDWVLLPAMVIQPFVENAFFHGISSKEEKGHINISFYHDPKYLWIEVEDDGVGRAKAKSIQKASVLQHEPQGMAITRERIEAISRSKGTKIEIIDKEEAGQAIGTLVRIRLPFKTQKETT